MFENLKKMPVGKLKRFGGGKSAAVLVSAKALDREQVFRQKFHRRTLIHGLNVANCAKALDRLPDDGEVFNLIMAGNFDGFDFIGATLKLAAPATIDELLIATLGFSESNAGELLELLDAKQIRRVTFLASCYMRDSSGHLYQPLAESLRKRGHAIEATRNHAKLLLMQLSDGRRVGIDGSMNLRSCRNVEQANVWQSRELFDFYARYIRTSCAGGKRVA